MLNILSLLVAAAQVETFLAVVVQVAIAQQH
jgi:hypothetical protein